MRGGDCLRSYIATLVTECVHEAVCFVRKIDNLAVQMNDDVEVGAADAFVLIHTLTRISSSLWSVVNKSTSF